MSKNNKIAGVDEVGRGCLAGPVFSAAVILNNRINKKDIKDSKNLTRYLSGVRILIIILAFVGLILWFIL